ncbi:EamA family transporter [Nostocaceae cyanobacterium CENA357]|uniref:EamA family transporter n=1 Tax=Atlanticothrix silvestris CENA357 TaxID=1725252 RepID=A0A8J7HGJ9_9CYAN|nr:EamA family transporter [Atlanticothrix silvestris]MBH8554892.1 EamA family transporter [Atlanticothrix silvestris CENA357]
MGRFEKRPDTPRVRGDLSRSAETALWAVVEDLEHLQQNVLRSLQEDIKKLQTEKSRLSEDIQQLIDEKEHLLQVRQITEQQVLIRQLAEALAKHISSQLQSSLTALASQAKERDSNERSVLKSAETPFNYVEENNKNVEKLLGTLDDNLTIAFNSLQQEVKNYQSSFSQQLSRMHGQQQEGEAILEELISQLRKQLTKTITEPPEVAPLEETRQFAQRGEPPEVRLEGNPPDDFSLQATGSPRLNLSAEPVVQTTPPTVLQPQVTQVSPSTVLQPTEQQPDSPQKTSTESKLKEERRSFNESTSVIPKDLAEIGSESPSATPPQLSEITLSSTKGNDAEPTSVIPKNLAEKNSESSPATPPQLSKRTLSSLKESATKITPDLSQSSIESSLTREKVNEPISLTSKDLSEKGNKSLTSKKNNTEPISVLNRDLSQSNTNSAPAPKQKATPSSPKSRSSSALSPIQIGFLLVVLSTVVSSLYNVAIKDMFHRGYEIAGVVEERLISATLGNIMLILTLRLLVVVPLMVLLAPMMYPQVWQDLQNLVRSTRGNPGSGNGRNQRIFQLSIASGCFLFLSQVLIYFALGQVAAGMAIALFFVYPLVSAVLSWLLFRDRPGMFRAAAIGSIFCGELLILAGAVNTGIADISLGSITAIFAGVAFACYVILTRICAAKLHPVSFTLINFATMLALSFIFLMLPLPSDWSLVVDPSKLLEIVLSAFILGVLTLLSYVFNHIGIGKLGASRAAIIGTGVPILTVIFAGLMIQETLEFMQILGVLFVTFGAAAFSFEKMRNQVKLPSSES